PGPGRAAVAAGGAALLAPRPGWGGTDAPPGPPAPPRPRPLSSAPPPPPPPPLRPLPPRRRRGARPRRRPPRAGPSRRRRRGEAVTARVAADLVVGAGGAHSAMRRRSGLGVHVGRGLRYIRGLGPEVSLAGMTEYWTGLGIFGVAPLPHGCYFYASTHAEPL